MKSSFLSRFERLLKFSTTSAILLAGIAITLGVIIQRNVGEEISILLGPGHQVKTGLIIWGGIGVSFLFIYSFINVLYLSTSRMLIARSEENVGLLEQTKKQLAERTEMEEELKRNYQIQTLLSSLLRVSLTDMTLDQQLDEILDQITTSSWLELKVKGCIYLLNEEQDLLVMSANTGLTTSLVHSFQENHQNLCLCGKSMGTGKPGSVEKAKVRHQSKAGENGHDVHYYLPIKYGEKRLGILNLLLSGWQGSNSKEDDFFHSVADVLAGIIEQRRTDDKLTQTISTLRNALGGTIHAMALPVETRDPYTAGHQRRVSNLARAIATEMHLSREQIEGVRIAGIVHDLGKISVPSEILSKPGDISLIEHSLINTHPQKGFEILDNINFPWPIARIVLQHHERLDGSGYPAGLKKNEILIEARVLAVADVVEAMASHRPYRPSRGIQLALEEITDNKGKLYDPKVVDACLHLFLNKGFRFDIPSDDELYTDGDYLKTVRHEV